MAEVNFSFRKPEHKIGDSITADVFVRFSPTWTRKIARHPVEGGSDVSDHVVKDPIVVTIEGVVSSSPLEYSLTLQEKSLRERVADVYDKLVEMWDDTSSTTLVELISGGKQFDNMCLTSLSTPDDSSNGDSLIFTATFEEFRFIEKKYVEVEYISDNLNSSTESASEKDVGEQTTGDLSDDQVKQSLLRKFLSFLDK